MVTCTLCERTRDGSRSDARRDRWEPFSTSSQWAIDSGPMVCPQCVADTLRDVLDAMRGARP